MGQIVQFRRKPLAAPRDRAVRGTADILIFTGVRYDRGKKPKQQPPHDAKRGGRKSV